VDQARAETIRDEDEYNGVRVAMTVELASARMSFHVDVNVGDPVVPVPGSVVLPRLRGGVLTLLGYPLAMVHAEKIVTMWSAVKSTPDGATSPTCTCSPPVTVSTVMN
jgi:hypothetical protein